MNTRRVGSINTDLKNIQKELGISNDFTNCSIVYELSKDNIVSGFLVNLPNLLMRIGRANFIVFEQNQFTQQSTINEDALRRIVSQMPRLLLTNVPSLVHQRFVFFMLGLVGSKSKERNHLMELVNELAQDSRAFREGQLDVLNQDLIEMMRWQFPAADQLMRAIERFEQFEETMHKGVVELTQKLPCSETDFREHLREVINRHKEFNWLK